MESLLRLVNATSGPIVALESVPQPTWFRPRTWCSRAKLAPCFDTLLAGRMAMARWGAAWHADKAQSQADAVTAALALALRGGNPHVQGLAVVAGRDEALALQRATCDAIGAGVATRFAQGKELPWQRVQQPSSMPLWPKRAGTWRVYACDVAQPLACTFVFSILCLPSGGIIVGSGCAPLAADAERDAMHATWARWCRFVEVCEAREPLIDKHSDQRLWNFATDAYWAQGVLRAFQRSELQLPVHLDSSVQVQPLAGPWDEAVTAVRVALPCAAPPPTHIDAAYFWGDADA